MHRQRHQTALERPELRQSTSPRMPTPGTATMPIKQQRTPELEAALRKHKQEQLIKDARLARALVQEGIELVEEGLERVGRR
jgi:hypothetical protein